MVVVGGGHAGVEAALIAGKLNKKVALVTMDKGAVGRMSCNPAVGGLAKGQMVRELDVLGGVMGRAADKAGIQFKVLNRSKGRSVWSPRAQVDKRVYEKTVNGLIFSHPKISVLGGEVVDVLERSGVVFGVILRDGARLKSEAVILTCGTFLNGLIHIGERKIRAGRMGESGSHGITEALVSLGFVAGRLKTGTPPRIDKKTINWQKTTPSHGDKKPTPFSYQTKNFKPPNLPCHTVKTGPDCRDIIQENMHTSPMFSGDVLGVGPRYCPSIEDKVHRFSHHKSHLLFLEPEWAASDQIYTNGFSTSLPERVQLRALRTVSGLESVRFFRPGYAIEYDFFSPSQLKSSLESKMVGGLFFAGQINGTSGYEEAAAQGLLAGVNAIQYINNSPPLVLRRDEAYLGVLVDDLITKDTLEPYRMFTSRAEYRILLRYSSAGRRLVDKARSFLLLTDEEYGAVEKTTVLTESILSFAKGPVGPPDINRALSDLNEKQISHKTPAEKLLMRPKLTISHLPKSLFKDVVKNDLEPSFVAESYFEAETTIKYRGYIKRQLDAVKKLSKQENFNIPDGFDYKVLNGISNEAREKLSLIRPETLGQAMRISGVSPADLSVLSVLLTKHK